MTMWDGLDTADIAAAAAQLVEQTDIIVVKGREKLCTGANGDIGYKTGACLFAGAALESVREFAHAIAAIDNADATTITTAAAAGMTAEEQAKKLAQCIVAEVDINFSTNRCDNNAEATGSVAHTLGYVIHIIDNCQMVFDRKTGIAEARESCRVWE